MYIGREFLQCQVWGAEPEDVQRTVVGIHGVNPYRVSQIIAALKQVATADHPERQIERLLVGQFPSGWTGRVVHVEPDRHHTAVVPR